MTSTARFFVVVSFFVSSLAMADARAALPWPETAVKNLQLRLKKGLCPAMGDDKLAQDVCAAYGLTKRSKTTGISLSKPNSSLLIIEQGGRVLKVERGSTQGEFIINRVRIDAFQAKTQAELKALIAPAIEKQTAQVSFFIEAAYAAPLNPEIPAMIQQLVAETNQLGSCSFYIDFGKKCTEGMEKVLAEIQKKKAERANSAQAANGFQQLEGRASYATQITHLNGHLTELHDQLEKSVFPSLSGYDTVRMCAIRKDPQNVDKIQADAEASLKDCREKVRQMVEATGGIREVKQTEGLMSRMWNRITGRSVAAMPSADHSAEISGPEDSRQ